MQQLHTSSDAGLKRSVLGRRMRSFAVARAVRLKPHPALRPWLLARGSITYFSQTIWQCSSPRSAVLVVRSTLVK